MMIYKNSKNGGFAVGSNKLTAENLVAGGITAVVGIVLALLFGFGKKNKKKKKATLMSALVLPAVFKTAKAAMQNKSVKITMDDALKQYMDEENDTGIEVVYAEPISSEEEVYEHIG